MRKIQNQKGTSFIEVMIALVIMGVITAAILRAYVTQHKNYMVQEDITEIQQNARASIDEISRNIRMAGYGLPVGLAAIEAYDTNPDTIVLIYNAGDCNTFLSAPMPQPSAELKCGSDVSCFWDGQWVYIYEADSAIGEWLQITEVQSASLHIQHNTTILSRKYGEKALVLALTKVKFYIDNTTDPDHPNLMMQLPGQTPQVYAENITDLQFKYDMKGGHVLNVPDIVQNVRDVQIELTGRSNTPELADNGTESYRDRSFRTTVYLRNIAVD